MFFLWFIKSFVFIFLLVPYCRDLSHIPGSQGQASLHLRLSRSRWQLGSSSKVDYGRIPTYMYLYEQFEKIYIYISISCIYIYILQRHKHGSLVVVVVGDGRNRLREFHQLDVWRYTKQSGKGNCKKLKVESVSTKFPTVPTVWISYPPRRLWWKTWIFCDHCFRICRNIMVEIPFQPFLEMAFPFFLCWHGIDSSLSV